MALQGTGNVNQTLPYPRTATQAKCRKDKWNMPTSKEYGLIRYMKYKIDICHTLRMQPKARYKDENPKTRLYRKAERERERDKPHGEAKPHNLLNIDLFGLASSYLHPCPFCSCLGSHAFASSVYMQWQRKQASRQAKKQLERRHAKGQTNKESQMGTNKHVKHTKGWTNMLSNKRGCPRRTNVGLEGVY